MSNSREIKGGEKFIVEAELPEGIDFVAIRRMKTDFVGVPIMEWGKEKFVVVEKNCQKFKIIINGVRFRNQNGKILQEPWELEFIPRKKNE